MKHAGGTLSPDQIKAGLKAMRGEFAPSVVMDALKKTGVIYILPAANKLIANELKAGRLEKVDRHRFRAVSLVAAGSLPLSLARRRGAQEAVAGLAEAAASTASVALRAIRIRMGRDRRSAGRRD